MAQAAWLLRASKMMATESAKVSSRKTYVRLVNCRLADMLKEKEEQRRKVLQANAVTDIKCQVAAAVLLHGPPVETMAGTRVNLNALRRWTCLMTHGMEEASFSKKQRFPRSRRKAKPWTLQPLQMDKRR